MYRTAASWIEGCWISDSPVFVLLCHPPLEKAAGVRNWCGAGGKVRLDLAEPGWEGAAGTRARGAGAEAVGAVGKGTRGEPCNNSTYIV